MRECIIIIKKLIDGYGLSWDDCKEIMVEEFKVPQPDVEVTFGSLKVEQFKEAKQYFTNLLNQYQSIETIIVKITEIAGQANTASVDAGKLVIFGNFHTETIDGIYYGEVSECLKTFEAWLQTWNKWAGN
jgi:hypothetical protein|tara:strand:- start:2449 stop:2838 length:390 start_codon:yes stop_codon:yes gene_type:complete